MGGAEKLTRFCALGRRNPDTRPSRRFASICWDTPRDLGRRDAISRRAKRRRFLALSALSAPRRAAAPLPCHDTPARAAAPTAAAKVRLPWWARPLWSPAPEGRGGWGLVGHRRARQAAANGRLCHPQGRGAGKRVPCGNDASSWRSARRRQDLMRGIRVWRGRSGPPSLAGHGRIFGIGRGQAAW